MSTKENEFNDDWEKFIRGYHEMMFIDEEERWKRFDQNQILRKLTIAVAIFSVTVGAFYLFSKFNG